MENLKTMVSQLTDDEVNTLYTMAMTAKLRELLGNQPIPQDFSFMELTAYLDEYKGKREQGEQEAHRNTTPYSTRTIKRPGECYHSPIAVLVSPLRYSIIQTNNNVVITT
jgi:hypothetical protein